MNASAQPIPDPAVSIEKLGKRYGNLKAVDQVSFQVQRGQVFGFMGHNGAGKTTIIRMLLGLTRPTQGTAHVLGLDVVRQSLAIRRIAGYLPGAYALPGDMTASGFLEYIAAMFGIPPRQGREKARGLLEQFGLSGVADKKLRGFSAGMTQKVGLAQALINEPEILFLDEPTAGLDPVGRHDFLEYIAGLARGQGVTVLFSTHILTDIESICEDVVILNRGKVVAQGPLEALKEAHGESRMDELYLRIVQEAA